MKPLGRLSGAAWSARAVRCLNPNPRVVAVLLALSATPALLAWATVPTGPRLRDLGDQNGLQIGTMFGVGYSNYSNLTTYKTVAGREYNLVTAEKAMKMAQTEPDYQVWGWNTSGYEGDQLATDVTAFGGLVHGHTLVWNNSVPTWFSDAPSYAKMSDYISHVVTHFKASADVWDVCNESIADDGSNSGSWTTHLKSGVWRNLGTDFVEKAFRYARAADSTAVLLYNDYLNEEMNTKSDNIYHMVQDFTDPTRSGGVVPIDGIGFQCHIGSHEPDGASIRQNFDRLANLGMALYITEFADQVPDNSVASLDDQARVYYNVLEAALRSPGFAGYQTWGLTDAHHYSGDGPYPLPFDSNYEAKPAYYAIQDALALEYRADLMANPGGESGLTSWTGQGCTLVSVTGTIKNGARAIQATNRTSDTSGPAQDVTAALLAQGAGRYYLSSWVKLSAAGSAKVTLKLVDGSGSHYLGVRDDSVSTAWSRIGGYVNVAWYKTLQSATLYVETPGQTGLFYIDDVICGDANLAANGDFEDGINGWVARNGCSIGATSLGSTHRYGLGGINCTSRTYSYSGPSQDITARLLAENSGTYNVNALVKMLSGTDTVKVTVRLDSSGGGVTYASASVAADATNWARLAGTLNLAWSGTLNSAILYLETSTTTNGFYADEVMVRK